MAWQERTGTSGLFYDQYGYDNYWAWLGDNTDYWAFDNCMANCTVYAIGRQYENGRTKPVTVMKNANKWHEVVNTEANWTLLNYTQGMTLEAGDILEWTSPANHVAVVENDGTNPTISGSWWTDNNGGSSMNNRTTGGEMGSTMESVSNFFKENYTYRFWHNDRAINTEAGMGYSLYPTYVLRYTGETPGPSPTPTPTDDGINIAIYFTLNKRRNNKDVKIIL